MPEKPLIEGIFLLEKMAGKGGWTFVRLPAVGAEHKGKWGTVKVKGLVDTYELVAYSLMPIKTGELFLPIKAEIRKHIGKKEGDKVQITLYAEEILPPIAVPEDLLLCLEDEPEAHKMYMKCTIVQKKAFLDWIGEATNDESRIHRIVRTINLLLNKQTKIN
ncbi:MAG: DUF1905 domain-containing protein [Pedobacter sp.]|nr:MAG: DUF1905 domain-containing protein [Pedobacter sp.]